MKKNEKMNKKKHPPIQITKSGLIFLERTDQFPALKNACYIKILDAIRDGNQHDFEEVRKISGQSDTISWDGCYVFLRKEGYISKI